MKYGCEERRTFPASAPRQRFERCLREMFPSVCILLPVHTFTGQAGPVGEFSRTAVARESTQFLVILFTSLPNYAVMWLLDQTFSWF